GEWKFRTAATLNNLLGGRYSIAARLTKLDDEPLAQPRSFSWGVSASLPSAWKFEDLVPALELKDIGNGGGSVFMHTHIGAEARLGGFFKPRLGIGQGYLSAGAGFDFKVASIEIATYGEEMGANVGT